MNIDQTSAYKKLDPIVQKLVMKRVNRIQIEDQIIIAKTIGLEKWRSQTGLQDRWQKIVEEIIKN